MTLPIALLTLLHLLIPIYWLGGDLGAYYSGIVLNDATRPASDRLVALKILLGVDMAPRTALIMALPTGVTLGFAKGWLMVPGIVVAGFWLGGLAWLGLAWAIHLKHGPAAAGLKRIDLTVRYVVLGGLLLMAAAGFAGMVALPLFIRLKLLVLAGCIVLGLMIRSQLVPLFPAIGAMRTGGATPQTDRAVAGVLARTRPTVITLWGLILVACFLGIATPV